MSIPARPTPPRNPAIDRLLACHREFLGFLESRLHDRASAEDVLQNAFVRTLDKAHTIRDDEQSVAWFYRLLRNALVDHYRRRAAAARALSQESALSQEQAEAHLPTAPDLEGVVCSCLHGLLPILSPEYGKILQRVDFDGLPLPAVATELGISRNNATVRLHRARQALKKALEKSCGTCAQHGCLDCSCGAPNIASG